MLVHTEGIMLKGIKGPIESKKALAAIFGALAVVACYLALEPGVADKVVPYLTAIVVGFMATQGIADIGKGKAQAEKALPDLPSIPGALLKLVGGVDPTLAGLASGLGAGEPGPSAPLSPTDKTPPVD